MEWQMNNFFSQSAPEPDIHQRNQGDNPTQFVPHSVPDTHNSIKYYHTSGFATQPYAGVSGHQASQYHSYGAGALQHPHRQTDNQVFGYNPPLSRQFTSLYAQGQSFSLFASHQGAQGDNGFLFNPEAPLLHSPTRDFVMDDMYDHGQHAHANGSMAGAQSFVPASEATYSGPVYPSTVTPVSVPAHPMSADSPRVSLPESSPSYNQSRLHERYAHHRLITTSGDPSTAGSMLFAEDAPQPIKSPSTTVNHYVTIDRLPYPEASSSPTRLSRVVTGDDAGKQPSIEPRAAPDPAGGIDSFCFRSFPHNQRLRDALRVVMHSIRENKDADLSQFLDEIYDNDGEKRWKCRFNGDRGLCDKTCNRRDTALGHIRQVHIKMLPISCNGECGDPTCSRRFPFPAMKSSHTRSGSIKCDKCHLLTSGRNITRHQRTEKCRQVATALAGSNGSA